jgi:hypothetical protein
MVQDMFNDCPNCEEYAVSLTDGKTVFKSPIESVCVWDLRVLRFVCPPGIDVKPRTGLGTANRRS